MSSAVVAPLQPTRWARVGLLDPWPWVLLFICLTPLVSASTGEIQPIERVHAAVLGITLYLWLLKRLVRTGGLPWGTPLTVPLVIYLAILTLSLPSALLHEVVLLDWAREWWPFLPLLLVFVFVTELDRDSRFDQLIYAYLISSAVIAAQAVLFFLSITQTNAPRVHIFRENLLLFVSPVVLPAFILAFALFVNPSTKAKRALALAVVLLLGARLFIHVGRLAFVHAVAAVLIILMLSRSRSYALLGSAAAVALAVGLGGWFGGMGDIIAAWQARFDPSALERGFVFRTEEWLSAVKAVGGTAAWGHGLGATFIRRGDVIALLGGEGRYSFVHSQFLFLLFHTGLLGVLSFYWLAYRSIWLNVSLLRQVHASPRRPLVIGILAVLLTHYIASFVSGVLTKRDMNLTLAVCFGILLALARVREAGAHAIATVSPSASG